MLDLFGPSLQFMNLIKKDVAPIAFVKRATPYLIHVPLEDISDRSRLLAEQL